MNYISSRKLAMLWKCEENSLIFLAIKGNLNAKKVKGKWLFLYPQQKPDYI